MRLSLNFKLWVFSAALSLFYHAPFASADNCYVECMQASSCWSERSDENVSYCSATQARCSTDCRDSGGDTSNSGGKSYGAIAYSKNDGSYGYSKGMESRKQAEKTAMGYCKQYSKHCKIAAWYYNQCAAVAADGRKIGVGLGATTTLANHDALKACSTFGKKNCEVKVSRCSY